VSRLDKFIELKRSIIIELMKASSYENVILYDRNKRMYISKKEFNSRGYYNLHIGGSDKISFDIYWKLMNIGADLVEIIVEERNGE
tara:strand:+ start:25914 stop:26171 length:258 start_codon:yes stop_codon:yes gene_type:complete